MTTLTHEYRRRAGHLGLTCVLCRLEGRKRSRTVEWSATRHLSGGHVLTVGYCDLHRDQYRAVAR